MRCFGGGLLRLTPVLLSASTTTAAAPESSSVNNSGTEPAPPTPPPPPPPRSPTNTTAAPPLSWAGVPLRAYQLRRLQRAASRLAAAAAGPEREAACRWVNSPWVKSQLSHPHTPTPGSTSSAPSSAASAISFAGHRLGQHPVLVLPPFSGRSPASARGATLDPFLPILQHLNHEDGALAVAYDAVVPEEGRVSDGPLTAEAVAARIRAARETRRAAVAAAVAAAPVADTVARIPHPHGDADYDADGFIAAYCHSVVAVLRTLEVSWVHVVGSSFGALVAAKLAAMYPRVVGTLMLVDTPLATGNDVASHAARNELYVARYDVNVPRPRLEEAVAAHAAAVKTAAPLMAPQPHHDAPLYDAIFGADETYSADRSSRSMGAWLSLDHLAEVQAPTMHILPNKTVVTSGSSSGKGGREGSATSATELEVARSLLNVRKVQHIKGATSYASFWCAGEPAEGEPQAPVVAKEVADGMQQFVQRYTMDAVIAKRFESAAELQRKQVMREDGGAKKPHADGAGDTGNGKKNKKKKDKSVKKQKAAGGGGGGGGG